MGRIPEAHDWLPDAQDRQRVHCRRYRRLRGAYEPRPHIAQAVAALQSGRSPAGVVAASVNATQSIGQPHCRTSLSGCSPARRMLMRYALAVNLLAVGEPDEAAAHALVVCGLRRDWRMRAGFWLDRCRPPANWLRHGQSAVPQATDEPARSCAVRRVGRPACIVRHRQDILAAARLSAMSLLGRPDGCGQPHDARPHLEPRARPTRRPERGRPGRVPAAVGTSRGHNVGGCGSVRSRNGGLLPAYAAWLRQEGRASGHWAAAQAAASGRAPFEWHLSMANCSSPRSLEPARSSAQALALRPASGPAPCTH
jgi:hypothetical protein